MKSKREKIWTYVGLSNGPYDEWVDCIELVQLDIHNLHHLPIEHQWFANWILRYYQFPKLNNVVFQEQFGHSLENKREGKKNQYFADFRFRRHSLENLSEKFVKSDVSVILSLYLWFVQSSVSGTSIMRFLKTDHEINEGKYLKSFSNKVIPYNLGWVLRNWPGIAKKNIFFCRNPDGLQPNEKRGQSAKKKLELWQQLRPSDNYLFISPKSFSSQMLILNYFH